MLRILFAGIPMTGAGYSAVTYNLRDARFFGTNPGRETQEAGVFTASSTEQLPANYTTGGATPTVFTGLATSQASPFRLGATIRSTPAISSGGVQTIDALYTAGISASTILNPGSVTVDLTNGLQLVGMTVVDTNGDPIPGTVIHSELLDLLNTPEPVTWGLMAAAVAAMMMRSGCISRRFRRRSSCRS